MKKLIVLAVVLGLLMVGTARADGAWVLWEQERHFYSIEYYINKPWVIVDVFDSYSSCQKVRQEKCNLMNPDMGWTTLKTKDMTIRIWVVGQFECLIKKIVYDNVAPCGSFLQIGLLWRWLSLFLLVLEWGC